MPVLLVGEALGPAGSPFDPRTPSGAYLAELLGVRDVRDVFGAVNLIDRWPGRTSHGARFPAGQRRIAATNLLKTAPTGTEFVLVGRRVATAFGLSTEPVLKWVEIGNRRVVIFPHPNARRWWSVGANARKAQRFLRGLSR